MKYGLWDDVRSISRLLVVSLLEHRQFAKMLSASRFVVTDGGSIQEEASFLGVPCLLLRNETERDEGLGKNVIVSEFNFDIIDDFLNNYDKMRRNVRADNLQPSKIIVDKILQHAVRPHSADQAGHVRDR